MGPVNQMVVLYNLVVVAEMYLVSLAVGRARTGRTRYDR